MVVDDANRTTATDRAQRQIATAVRYFYKRLQATVNYRLKETLASWFHDGHSSVIVLRDSFIIGSSCSIASFFCCLGVRKS